MGENKSSNSGCQPGQYPWLIYSVNNPEEVFCNVSPFPPHDRNESCVKSIPELRGKYFIACCHGWLILQDNRERDIISLYNPRTLEILHLPPLYYPFRSPNDLISNPLNSCHTLVRGFRVTVVKSAVLTCSPDDANSDDRCLLLLFLNEGNYFCWPRRPNPSWSEHELSVSMYGLIALDGVIYGCACDYIGDKYMKSIVSLEVADDHDDSNPLKLSSLCLRVPASRFRRATEFMVESCGHIYLVYLHYKDWVPEAVEVWEFDLQGMNWVEVKSLDGRAFFLSYHSSTWCWGSKNPESGGGIEENCVYFTYYGGQTLYSYNLEDCSFYANSLTPLSYYLWVMPQHQSLLTRGEWKQRNEKVNVIDQEGFRTTEYKGLQQHNSGQENLFCDLPVHIIELISKYLHLFDYWNFRASCRIFHSATPTPQWRTNNFFPLLMFAKNADGVYQVMDPFRDYSHYFILGLYRDLLSIDFTKDGWLLVRFVEKSLRFCNPFTRVKGNYPPNEFTDAFKSIGFSTNPTSPDCLTVGICEGDSHVVVHYLQYGDEAWSSCSFSFYRDEAFEFVPGTFSPVYHDGAFYFVDESWGYLGVFKLLGGEPSWHCYERPSDDTMDSYYLVECDGQLLSVEIGYMGKWVKVLRFNKLSKNWVRVKSLGNHILFISHSSSFSAVTRENGMGNKIFFSRLKGNCIVFYSLDTSKFHVLGSEEDSLEDFYGTRKPMHSCWV